MTYFDSDISHLIARTTYTGSGNFVGVDDNVGTTDVKGLEIEANYAFSEQFEIESTATYTDSVNKANNENTRTVVPYKLNLSFILRPAKQWKLVWDNCFRWQPTTDSENALYEGADAKDWILSNLTLNNDRAFDVKGLKLSLSIRNISNEEYGHVDPRATINPSAPFLTSYPPQESINILFGINYRFN